MATDRDTVSGTGDLADMRQLRHALGRFATGVAIVTTRDVSGRRLGLTINSFSSLSLDPPLVIWSLDRKSRSLEGFREAGGFAVNVLSRHQSELARRFSSSDANRFDGLDHLSGGLGMPLLRDTLAWFECKISAEIDGGDHVLFIGEVVSYQYCDGDPLLYYRGGFASLFDGERPGWGCCTQSRD